MDAFDYHDEIVRPPRDTFALVLNLLTVVVVLAALCVGTVFLMIFINPYIGFNPFPPPTLPSLASFPTATPTPRDIFPPTWTPTASLVPTATRTPLPTQVQSVTRSTVLPGTPLPGVPTGEGMPFILHAGDPVAIPNIGHPQAACDWMGVAGRVFNLSGAPITQGLFVQLSGTLNSQAVDMLSMVGTANQYGQGGYEFVLGDKPVASDQELWVQLFDQAMVPLSDKIFFDTFAECNQNLVVINFNQVR